MKILVSTKKTQGMRENDFCFVPENEIVAFGITCDRDFGYPDGNCGCFRDFNGVITQSGTTTAKVIDSDITFNQYVDAILNYEKSFDMPCESEREKLEQLEEVYNMVWELIGIASMFDIGAIIEKRGFVYNERR